LDILKQWLSTKSLIFFTANSHAKMAPDTGLRFVDKNQSFPGCGIITFDKRRFL
jgi:hypothetical protein